MPATVIYDSSERVGHQLDYIKFLTDYVMNGTTARDRTYIFVLHPNLYCGLCPLPVSSNLIFIQIPNDITSQLKNPSNTASKYYNSQIEGPFLKAIINQYQVDKLVFMILDSHIVLAGRRKFYPSEFQISGIYFRPLPGAADSSGHHKRIKDRAKQFVKAGLLKTLIYRSKITRIFIPEDQSAISWLSRHVSDSVFSYLPDPIDQHIHTANRDWFSRYGINGDEPILLVFGVIGKRKNVINIIKAFEAVQKRSSSSAGKLLIVGKFESEHYKQKINELLLTNSDLRHNVVIVDRFVSNEEREQLFAGCHVVLMPYLNFHGTSGVLCWAAKYKKPVLVSTEGVVADLVRIHKLGLTTDSYAVENIATAITNVLLYQTNEVLTQRFLVGRTPEKFSQILLS